MVQKAFNQADFVKTLNAQVLADIWLPVALPPVSFEPFSETEQKAIESGTFTFVGRVHGSTNRSQGNSIFAICMRSNSYVLLGDYHSRRNNQMSTGNYQQRPAAPRRNFQQNEQSPQQGSRFGGRFERNHFRAHEEDNDEVIEDPDSLWATPSAEAVGSGDFGSFDENGIFRAAGAASDFSMPPLRPEEFGFPARASKPVEPNPVEIPSAISSSSAAAAAAASSSFFFSSPVNRAAPEPASSASQPTTTAIPQITPDTQWLYRDPSGHVQGPFSSVRMLEWYNGNYFPENLPLRREQDPFFEPLSMWKVKCAGQIPFAAYTQKKPEPPPSSRASFAPAPVHAQAPTQAQPQSISVDDWFTPKQAVTDAPVPKQAAQQSTSRSVALESLFGNSSSATAVASNALGIEKPGSPDVLMPAAGAWKKQAASSVKFGSIESEMAQMALAEQSKTEQKSFADSKSWGSESLSMKKISLTDILKESPPAAVEQPEAAAPQSLSASQAGWAKLASSPVQPLSAIQAEEAHREAERRQSAPAPAPSGSKSFADLVRSAGVASGNIVVTASQSPVPAVPRKSVLAEFKPDPVIQAQPAAKPVVFSQRPSVADWCQSSLASTPLAKLIDPLTCTTLLLDLPNSAAILNFALDTLQPLLATSKASFDLAGFAAELATRKFGKEASEKINWGRLASTTAAGSDFSFETVKRKKK